MIQVSDKNILINGKPELLFGGELHYFRLPKENWRARVKQIKEAGANLVSTYVPWKFHEHVEGEIDLEGTTNPVKDLKTFFEILKEENMYCLVRPGPYVMAEVDYHGVPIWFHENYPESLAKDEAGNSHTVNLASYLHPTYLEKVEIWYHAVCEIIKPYQITNGGPIIMFQLDNEVGMFHWVTNQGDYNDVTMAYFKDFLEKKYDKTSFSQTYGEEFDNIAAFVANNVKNPEENYALALQNDYSLFKREHYLDYLIVLKEFAENCGINLPWVVNVHGFDTIGGILKRGMKYPIGLSQLLETTKLEGMILAGDYYIGNMEFDNYTDVVVANAFTNAIQPSEQPLFSAEFQSGVIFDKPRLQPSAFDLLTRLCFANGMNAVNYYMFVGGENYEDLGFLGRRHEWQAPLKPDGGTRAHYKTIAHLGKMFKTHSKTLLKTKPVVNTHLGFYPDYFMTEYHNEYSKEMMKSLEASREYIIFDGVVKGITTNNIAYDGYNILDGGHIDVSKIPSLWLFTTKWMDESVQEKLVAYIKSGGELFLFPTIPTLTLKNKECTILYEFINVEQKELKRGFMGMEEMDNIVGYFQTFEADEHTFAWLEDTGEAVGIYKMIGSGKVGILGWAMPLDFDYQIRAIALINKKFNIASDFKFESETEYISAYARKNPKGEALYLFLQNFDEVQKHTTITYQGKVICDGFSVVIPGKAGLMLPINTALTDDLFIEYATAEIYNYNENGGELTLEISMHERAAFKFRSSIWIPIEDNELFINKIDDETFVINIETANKNFDLKFRRATI